MPFLGDILAASQRLNPRNLCRIRMNSNGLIKAYFLPGMATDQRLYSKMTIKGVEPVFIDWPPHQECKSLHDYAQLLAERFIQSAEPHVLVGSSMGGMVAVELSHITHPLHTYLLSAPATRREFPRLLNRVRASRVHKILGPKTVFQINRLADVFMGFKTAQDRAVFYEMLAENGPDFLHFAVNAVLEWDGQVAPAAYTQMLGSEDKLFPPHCAEAIPQVIDGGGHFTTFEFPQELSERLNRAFSELRLPLRP